jgi:TM2 domain-containing membrane protein YozV
MAGKKSSLAAVVLSLIVAGAGHLYLKSYRKAAMFFLFGELFSVIVYLYAYPDAGVLLGLFAGVYSALDAYRMNEKTNASMKIEKTFDGPDIRI